ncbi:MAG: hypothetical protein ACFFCZ_06865 [Promethearchaeota archaeon]
MLLTKQSIFTGYSPFLKIEYNLELEGSYENFRRTAKFISYFTTLIADLRKKSLITFVIRDSFPVWTNETAPTHLLLSLFWSNIRNRIEENSEFMELYKNDFEWLEAVPYNIEKKEITFEFLFRAKSVLEALNEQYFFIVHVHTANQFCQTILRDLVDNLEQPSIGIIFSSFSRKDQGKSVRETVEEILSDTNFEEENFINFLSILLKKYLIYLKNNEQEEIFCEIWDFARKFIEDIIPQFPNPKQKKEFESLQWLREWKNRLIKQFKSNLQVKDKKLWEAGLQALVQLNQNNFLYERTQLFSIMKDFLENTNKSVLNRITSLLLNFGFIEYPGYPYTSEYCSFWNKKELISCLDLLNLL